MLGGVLKRPADEDYEHRRLGRLEHQGLRWEDKYGYRQRSRGFV